MSSLAARNEAPPVLLPTVFTDWFAARGWQPRSHQLAVLEATRSGRSCLVIAPTGGGKTLAGFLPTLVDLATHGGGRGLHTLYVSPLKALTVDIKRNLEVPVAEMALKLRLETRTGDTPAHRRQRQRRDPPDILLTTPESLALLLSYPDAATIFGNLRFVVADELHAMAGTKRGDQLALGMARLAAIAPGHRRIGLSATVAEPARLEGYLGPSGRVARVIGRGGVKPDMRILISGERVPWAGHSARHAFGELYETIKANGTTLVFVNTRSQAELVFQELWKLNEDALPIALHHGSLAVESRRKVEAAMTRGGLRAVVCTSTLDLGIDWGAVDLVVQVGAPKGISRMLQRIGRSNHRMDAPSRALLVPANRFELLECRAALEAIGAGKLDGAPREEGGLDVLAQHILGTAASGPFDPAALFAEVTSVPPYAGIDRALFDRIVDYVATGGYALRAYDRFKRLYAMDDGRLRIANERVAHQFRMNVGTIVEEPMLKVRRRRGRVLGEIEEYYILGLEPGATFLFAGRVWALDGIRENEVLVSPAKSQTAQVPIYGGGRFPPTTNVAEHLRAIIADPARRRRLPPDVQEWLRIQQYRSVLPRPGELLVETFPRARKQYMVCYPFEGRPAHQTLGMLLTRRMQRAGLGPLGFMCNDYALAIWSLRPITAPDPLFDEDMLGDDLEEWMAESSLLKRTFRNVGIVAGLIERRHPGREKNGRQVTFSSDLLYDVLRRYEPDHVLLQATRREAAGGLLDVRRLADMLARVKGHIVMKPLERVSPLAVPIMLEISKQMVGGDAEEDLLAEAEETLIADATRLL
ncbi:MAG: ligase-associated DNA damage response DEXH box helicase [Proteobacteria bacterium]|nr:ligase-associated DNA damage response DEXH box helicase [Pseudomonadota bacterium]MDA1071975.1 ligase-associated DNA damage response DEXH box helicase [Pseudomonadota bacterium]